jgi:hypothetical protein
VLHQAHLHFSRACFRCPSHSFHLYQLLRVPYKQIAVLRTDGWVSIGVRRIVSVVTGSVNPGGIVRRGFLFHFFLNKDGRLLVDWPNVFLAVLLFLYIHYFYLAAKLLTVTAGSEPKPLSQSCQSVGTLKGQNLKDESSFRSFRFI